MGAWFRRCCATVVFSDLFRGFVCGLCLAAVLLTPGCASTGSTPSPSGPASVASVAADAAASGLIAYTQALGRPDVTRDEAFRLATQAAIDRAAVVVPLAVAEEYRPFITLALAALATQLDAAKVSGSPFPSGDSVQEAIRNAIEGAKQ